MEPLLIVILTFVTTWTLRTAIRWWWFPPQLTVVEVPQEKQRTLKNGYVPGDSRHYWGRNRSDPLAFTDHQLLVASERGRELELRGIRPPRRSFLKLLLCLD